MSIIHEALKKVQSNRSQNTDPQTARPIIGTAHPDGKAPQLSTGHPASQSPIPGGKTARPWLWQRLIWLCVITALGVVIVFNLAQYFKHRNELLNLINAGPTTTQTPAPALLAPTDFDETVVAAKTQTQEPPAPQKGEIVLSGIIVMDGKNFALINNEYYEIGDEVQGARITEITPDSVQLSHKGNTKTLKIITRRSDALD